MTTHACPRKNADGVTDCGNDVAGPDRAVPCSAHSTRRAVPAAHTAPAPAHPPVAMLVLEEDGEYMETPDELDDAADSGNPDDAADAQDEARWIAAADQEMSGPRAEAERAALEYAQAQAVKAERFERVADALGKGSDAGLLAVVRDDGYNAPQTLCLSCADPDEVEDGEVDYLAATGNRQLSLYDECPTCGSEYGEALPADVADGYGY